MKSTVFKVLTMLPIVGCWNVSLPASPATYSIGVRFPESLSHDSYEVPAYYKGHKINLHRWTSLPAGQPCSILITPTVSFKTQGNTVHYLKRDADKPCLWFDLTLTFCNEEDEGGNKKSYYDWIIEERDEDELPLRILDHTLIVLVDPAYIKGLVVEPAVPNSVDVVLPTIYFKDDIQEQDLKDGMVKVLMEAMDLDGIHCKTCPCSVSCKECVVISTPKPTYEPRS